MLSVQDLKTLLEWNISIDYYYYTIVQLNLIELIHNLEYLMVLNEGLRQTILNPMTITFPTLRSGKCCTRIQQSNNKQKTVSDEPLFVFLTIF